MENDGRTPESHYGVGTRCYGGLLTVTPTWAIWSFCPCSRQTIFFLCSLWQYPLIIAVWAVVITLLLLAGVVVIGFLPITGILAFVLKDSVLHVVIAPGAIISGVIAAVIMLALECAWAIFVLPYVGSLFLLQFLGCNVDTSNIFFGSDNGDRPMEIWCFPVVFTFGVVIPATELLNIEFL